ncbi:MAG: polysaccharide deacetylase family protein [Halofilum sp. (in: g-proteobacteria)]|nr:polysaccharide deacetylase family protein [Halofilum sp. (in: g-proteobacteria)]
MDALISIHDVTPRTLDQVEHHVGTLRSHGHEAITLLVVPGRDWGQADIARLARWQLEGLELAAHGWHHHAPRLGGPGHWLHAALLSRRAAEHLALGPDAIARLMQDAADWFPHVGLEMPTTYVPPAWALGPIRSAQLRALPFERIEVTRGLLFPATGRLTMLPLVGFEADTPTREHFLRAWNRWQLRLARRGQRPLRIGIHPGDHELRLADQLSRIIAGDWHSRHYRDYRDCQRSKS